MKKYFPIGLIICSLTAVGQDTLYHEIILDSARTLSDKGAAISLLKNNLHSLEENEDYFKGLYYLRLGNIYGNQHQLNLGEAYYRKALEVGLLIKSDQLTGQGYLGIGGIQLIQQLHDTETAIYDSILYYFEMALPYLKADKDFKNLEGLYANIALILTNTGEIDSAKKSLEISLQNRMKRDDKIGIIGSLNNIGLLHRKSKNYIQAERFYTEAFNVAESDTMLNEMASAKLGLARMYMESKNSKEALSNFLEYDSLNKLFLNAEFQKQIAEAETKYEAAEKQVEIDKRKRQISLLIIVLFSILIISIIGYFLIRQRRKATKVASEKAINDLLQEQEMKTAYALLEGQDKERKRVASELHDNLGSILTSLNMFSDALLAKNEPEKIKDIVNKISETTQLANQEVRKISHSLDSGLLKHFGLRTAIIQLMEAIQSSKKIQMDLELQIEDQLDNEIGIEIYRMIQELVNNSLKHSECTKIRLDVSHIEGEMSIIFHDNGLGFDQSKVEKGMGLNNIGKRVAKLNGGLSIESSLGKGSTFIIELPNV